jgi:hypothetical protein
MVEKALDNMHDKGSELTRNGRNIPKHNKGYI